MFCGTGAAPGTSIDGVLGYLDDSGTLVSDEGSAADDHLATAQAIVDDPDAAENIPGPVNSEAATLVGEGDGSYVAVLSKIGNGATALSVVFVAYDA